MPAGDRCELCKARSDRRTGNGPDEMFSFLSFLLLCFLYSYFEGRGAQNAYAAVCEILVIQLAPTEKEK